MAVVLVAVCATAIVRTVWHSKPAPPQPHTATLRADGRLRATLEVLTGTPRLTIDFANFGLSGTLLRVTTPASGSPPQLAADGGSAVLPAGSGVIKVSAKDAAAVAITLSSAVGWQLDGKRLLQFQRRRGGWRIPCRLDSRQPWQSLWL